MNWGILTFSGVYLSIGWFELGCAKSKVVRRSPFRGASREVLCRKDAAVMGYILFDFLIWESLVGCLWLAAFKFHFLGFNCIDSSLGFGVITQSIKTLEPPQSNSLLKFKYFAAAKSIQLCPTLCNPIDGSPPGSPIPGILQARILEWVAISSSNAWKWKVKVKSLSRVWLLATPWTAAHQAPPSMGFSRQEYWSGVPLHV